MTLRDRIRSAWSALTTVPAPTGKPVPDWPIGVLDHPFIPPEPLESHRDAFRKVPMVAASIGQVQHDFASLPTRVYRVKGETRVLEVRKPGNLTDLLAKANPWETGYSLKASWAGSLKWAGNAYLFLQRIGGRREPAELWLLPAHNVKVEATANRGVRRYWYDRGSPSEVQPEDIVHFRSYNPDDEPIGMSCLEPVTKLYEAQYYAYLWVKNFYNSGGMLQGLFSVKDGGARLSPAEIEALIATLKRRHVGYQNVGNPVVVQGIEWLQRGLTMSEMEIDATLRRIDAEICRAVGVPPWKMGIKEGSNLGSSGANVDERMYWDGCIRQLATMFDSVLNERLAPLFGTDLVIETDLSGVPALQSALLAQSVSLVALAGRPLLTVNEAREQLGFDPSDDETADELYTKPEPQPFGGMPGFPPEPRETEQSRSLSADPGHRDELRKRADVNLSRYEREVAVYFRSMFAEQRERVLAWAKEVGGRLTRVNRLIAIETEHIPIDVPTDREKFDALIRTLIARRGAEAIADIGVEVAFDIASAGIAAWVAARTDFVLSNVNATTTEAVRQAIVDGIAMGDDLGGIVARINEVFDSATQARSLLIARTETTGAYNYGSMEGWRQSGVVEKAEWLTAGDGLGGRHATADYAGLDGQQAELGGYFTVGNARLQFPGDPAGPPEEICNCLLPGNRVSGSFVGGLEARYSGPAREFQTASGKRFSVTANHPVLTAQGWRFAHELRKGDQLVSDLRSIGVRVLGDVHDEHGPAAVEDVVKSLRSQAGEVTRVAGALDLHGDARFTDGKVNVVGSDRVLLNYAESGRADDGGDVVLVSSAIAESAVDGSGAPNLDCEGVVASSPGDPCSLALTPDPVRVFADCAPLGEFGPGASSDFYVALNESAPKERPTEAGVVGKLLERFSGQVAFDELVEVRDFSFAGHVYDLQSVTGHTLAESIVISNCRCTTVPVVNQEQARRLRWTRYFEGANGNGNGKRAHAHA